MTTTDPATLRLEVARQRIAADLMGFSRHLAEAAVQAALLQNWPGVVSNLASAAQTLKANQHDGALAWQLILLGIGDALTQLANEQPPTLVNDADVDIIKARIGEEAQDLLIPSDFVDHPWTLPPVILAKKTLLEWLSPPSTGAPQQDLANLSRRFDYALVLGLHRAIRRDEARYRPILTLRYDSTAAAWQQLEDWRLYRAQLIAEFRSNPVFDETFSLDQIYIPLNAWQWEKKTFDDKTEPRDIRKVVQLNDDILNWLLGERDAARLRLVSGGPGSGKSSAMKALAAHLSERGNAQQPIDVLLFPLQRFQWRTGIVESISATIVEYSDQMRHNPLRPEFLRHRETPLLLIFDGLDELTTSIEIGEAISATFLRELTTALRTWNEYPIWAIVTGRDAIFGNVVGPTATLPGELFQILPYHVRKFETAAPNRADYHDPQGLLQTDNRQLAYRRFTEAVGQASDDPPASYSNAELHDVTAQPLLNYFLLTAGPDEVFDGNVARIYRQLFTRLHARNRNIGGRPEDAGKPGAGLSQEEFDRIFETMAVAAWRTGGTRSATWEDVLAEAEREDTYLRRGEKSLQAIFDSSMQQRGIQRPFRLAAAFFMRNSEATGVEFTHKSFGDYLYARRLAKAIASMMEALLVLPEAEREMLGRLEALTAERRMSNEVRRFLELELQVVVDDSTKHRWFNTLAPIVERTFRNGYVVSAQATARRAEQLASHLEEALFVAWHALWRPQAERVHWTLSDTTADLLRRALARQESAHGVQMPSVFLRAWSGVDLSGKDLHNANLEKVNLEASNLDGAKMQHANLAQANLEGATLKRAVLYNANLSMANLVGANLQNANLVCADLEEATFDRADLRASRLIGVTGEMASFDFANLEKANLKHAELVDVSFTSANLEGAELVGADLDYANFENANLVGANLTGASVRGAVFKGANLRGATLSGVKIVEAQLEDATFDPAILHGISLTKEG